ncbi:MAG: Tat binding protein 1-interacting protein-domain-containing protein [Monoraphidium minutum]|nr:MAG: Tat binding protein 1-interacting protein-domain-containing protein [Monoraphidium minutum]
MADAEVLALVRQHNKPFNAVGIEAYLAPRGIKKAAVQRALDNLAAAGHLTAKEFGKTKVYLPPQDGLEVLGKEDMDARKAELKALQLQLAEETKGLREQEEELRGWGSSLTAEQLREQTADLKQKTEAQSAKLAKMRSGVALVTADERAAVEKGFVAAMDAWRKRRGIFRGIWDTISESMEGKQSDLFDEIGVDTDESAGISFQELSAQLPAPGKRRKV